MDDKLSLLLILIPTLPLLGAILAAVLGPRVLRDRTHFVVIAALLAAFLCSVSLLREVRRQAADAEGGFSQTVTLWTWADIERAYDFAGNGASVAVPGAPTGIIDLQIDVTLRADALTSVMLLMITLVSSLVALFAAGYMRGDPGFWRFFAYFGLFVFSMTMLVSVSNFVLLFVFWEAVGLCSYFLIGFWYQKPEAAAAGKKAFLVNRVGDFGFTLALFLIWTTYGSLNFHDTEQPPSGAVAASSAVDQPVAAGVLGPRRIAEGAYAGGTVGFAICICLLIGACGKSAQFPLHIWLPDAMEGPTPVSALIHAATMVTAGVYMIARCSPLFMVSPEAQLTVACVGGVTALLAALIALTQYDLKRVLAYSTVSQLGYMFMALGVGTFGGITAGMFHLFTHAFFKALLFLGAGSVMHAMGHVIDMRRFGGLRRRMPATHLTFFVGCLALAGFPGLSGFWSKDAIVAALHDKAHHSAHVSSPTPGDPHPAPHSTSDAHADPSGHGPSAVDYSIAYRNLYFVALITAFLTAFYTFRALYMTFYGSERIPYEAAEHGHESPPIMVWPLRILAIGAACIGFLLDRTWTREPTNLFAEFVGSTPSLAGGQVAATRVPFLFHEDIAAISSLIAVAAILLATYLYLGGQREVRWLRRLFDFDGFSAADVSRPFAVGSTLYTRAQRFQLGWLVTGFGHVVSTVWAILAAPFLLGNFISPYKISQRKFFIDELYHFFIVLPLRMLAWLCYLLDRWLVDGVVNLIGTIPRAMGGGFRCLQLGLVPFYTFAMVLGMLVLVAARILWAGG